MRICSGCALWHQQRNRRSAFMRLYPALGTKPKGQISMVGKCSAEANVSQGRALACACAAFPNYPTWCPVVNDKLPTEGSIHLVQIPHISLFPIPSPEPQGCPHPNLNPRPPTPPSTWCTWSLLSAPSASISCKYMRRSDTALPYPALNPHVASPQTQNPDPKPPPPGVRGPW